jgi:endonuclease-3
MPRLTGASPDVKTQARKVVRALASEYPEVTCALRHRNAFELLVATILSAQCTDVRVNMVTPELFARFPDARALAQADVSELEALIRSTGFFRSKTKSLLAMSNQLATMYDGDVPRDLEALVKLPGVGRKTANVVLGTAFAIASGVVVDTHVKRLAKRLGLTSSSNPAVIERELAAVVPRKHWVDLSHRLIAHGRQVCLAQRPRCRVCALASFCPKTGVPPRYWEPGPTREPPASPPPTGVGRRTRSEGAPLSR